MKVAVEKQSNKKSQYRVKVMGFTVSVHTENEAKRVKNFIQKLVKATL